MPEEEELDPRRQVLDEITQWAQLGEADGMRERYGKPPREPPSEDALGEGPEGEAGSEPIPGVELTEDGEPPPPEGGELATGGEEEELDPELLRAALAAMGG